MLKKGSFRQLIIYSGIAFGVIALFFGIWSHHNLQANPLPRELSLKAGTALPTPREVAPFQLQSAPGGQAFTNAQLKGHWSMLFFGFTNCAMLCPTTLSTLNQFYGNLQSSKVTQLPEVLFISIDPERDSLKRITQFVSSFNKNFRGATGSEKQLDTMTNDLNILYNKAIPNKSGDYQIDHSGTVLLIDPNGHLAAVFSPPLDPENLSKDYQVILKAYKQ